MKKLLLALSLLCCSMAVQANGTGTISKLAVSRSGYQVFVKLTVPVQQVSCRTRTDFDYYLDLTAQGSREILSALLAAKGAEQVVEVQSTGSCDAAGNFLEVIGYVIIH